MAGFPFSLREVIQKGPNLLNGTCLHSQVHQQLKVWLKADMAANRKVTFSQQKKKTPKNKKRIRKKKSPEILAAYYSKLYNEY